jgi:U3 small nucleolar RNA-associated protein 22
VANGKFEVLEPLALSIAIRKQGSFFPYLDLDLSIFADDTSISMASPATKRRKLSHSSEDSANDNNSFASFSSHDPSNGGSQSNEVPSDSGDVEFEGLDNESGDNGSECAGEQMHVEGGSSEEEDEPNKPIVTETRIAPRKVGDLNGTIYNGEVFKSNLFKLQVEELLNQVRPGHTKKNDSIESVVRTLKTIIEKIPARKPTPVRSMAISSPQMVKRRTYKS